MAEQALGVLLFFLCYARLPFSGDSKLQVLNGEFSVPPGRPAQFEDLIRGLLTVDPGARTDINEVLHRLERLTASLPETVNDAGSARTPTPPPEAPSNKQSAVSALPAAAMPARRTAAPSPSTPAAPAAPASRACLHAHVQPDDVLKQAWLLSPGACRTGGSPVKPGSLEAAHAAVHSAHAMPSAVLWPPELEALAQSGASRTSSPGRTPGRAADAPSRSAQGAAAGEGRAVAGPQGAALLQQQLTRLTTLNAQLQATVSAQQDTIRSMQARWLPHALLSTGSACSWSSEQCVKWPCCQSAVGWWSCKRFWCRRRRWSRQC